MPTATVTLQDDDGTQTMVLPDPLQGIDATYEVVTKDGVVILKATPNRAAAVSDGWDRWFENLPAVSEDFDAPRPLQADSGDDVRFDD